MQKPTEKSLKAYDESLWTLYNAAAISQKLLIVHMHLQCMYACMYVCKQLAHAIGYNLKDNDLV